MFDHTDPGGSPPSKPIDAVLGLALSLPVRRFTAEHADFLLKVDFKDIRDHSMPEVRCAEGHYSFNGVRHTMWLDRESPDFEGLLMHEVMRAIVIERGFPKAICPPALTSCPYIRYLSFLLSNTVADPVIDRRLMEGGFEVYNRRLLIDRAMAEVWHDAKQEASVEDDLLCCKWALFTVLLRIDSAFEADVAAPLHRLIRRKFPLSADIGDRFSTCIKETGFTDVYSALIVMVRLRNALKLSDKIVIIDGHGRYWQNFFSEIRDDLPLSSNQHAKQS